MSTILSGKQTRKTVRKLAENWQRCRIADLPALFSAYDEDQAQTERVVTYRLDADSLTSLLKEANNGEDFRFVVHLGITDGHLSPQVPKTPPFVLLIQVLRKAEDFQRNCYALTWAEDSRFTDPMQTDSGINAIPAASAYLFVYSWLETPAAALPNAFESVAHEQDCRVKTYSFSTAESRSIKNDIARSLASGNASLLLHLGKGIAVKGHPFSFRPVLEVEA
ncbi:MAG: hypothetical protein AAF597_04200, partial [Bacteroidota bacterium]